MSSSLQRNVSKIVIPVAGMGTRFLPATKVLPKELLPIIDKPIIHHIVSEAADAGIETVIFVTSRPKVLIEDYFDPGDLTSHRLSQAGKEKLIEDTLALSKKIEILSIRQYDLLGLGHAVLQAAPVVEGQCFAVVLGDDIVSTPNTRSAIGQCLDIFKEKPSGSVVGVLGVEDHEVEKYGIAEVDENHRVTRFIEKPKAHETNSRLALPGRYIFEPFILEELRNAQPGKNGELQLTDAMESLRKKSLFYAAELQGERFDTGDKLGYIKANIAYALKNPEYKNDLMGWLKKQLEALNK